jgi:pimeloyl-ACP methyl ester carboxylesterase
MNAFARPILRSASIAAGQGAPVLLLHGSASSSAMWNPAIEVLKPRFRVIAPDLIGYGRTDAWPAGHAFSLDEEVRLIAPLIEHAPTPAHVVAHSYGGAVALRLATAHPELIRSLTLIEPVAFYLLRVLEEREAFAEVDAVRAEYVARFHRDDDEGAMRHFTGYWAGGDAWLAMDESTRALIRRAAPKVLLDWQSTFADGPSAEALRRLTMPARLITGERSPFPPRRIVARLAQLLPSAQVETVAGAGHLLPMTHMPWLAEKLVEWLEG